jgi:hypothetical protein
MLSGNAILPLISKDKGRNFRREQPQDGMMKFIVSRQELSA